MIDIESCLLRCCVLTMHMRTGSFVDSICGKKLTGSGGKWARAGREPGLPGTENRGRFRPETGLVPGRPSVSPGQLVLTQVTREIMAENCQDYQILKNSRLPRLSAPQAASFHRNSVIVIYN